MQLEHTVLVVLLFADKSNTQVTTLWLEYLEDMLGLLMYA